MDFKTKNTGLIFGMAIFLVPFFTSCLQNSYEPEVQTPAQEQMALKVYLDGIIANGTDVDTTAMGNYYVVMEEGEGAFAKPGDTLTVGYAGYFIDGNIFDASEWHNPLGGTYQFILGNPPMIPGWDEGIQLMNQNKKIQLIIPSSNAYGENGSGSILPFTTLVFVIKMVEIKPVI